MSAHLLSFLDTIRSKPEIRQALSGFSTVPFFVYVMDKILPVSSLILPQVFVFRNRMSRRTSNLWFINTAVRPLATTLDFLDHSICEIDGDDDLAVSGVEVCEVNPGADTHDVRRLLLAECRVAVFHISAYAWSPCLSGDMPKSGLALLPVVSSTNVIFCLVMATFLHSAVLSLMTIPISGRAS